MWRNSWDPAPTLQKKVKPTQQPQPVQVELLELHPVVEILRNGTTATTTKKPRKRR